MRGNKIVVLPKNRFNATDEIYEFPDGIVSCLVILAKSFDDFDDHFANNFFLFRQPSYDHDGDQEEKARILS